MQTLIPYLMQALDGEGDGESPDLYNVYLTYLVKHLVTQEENPVMNALHQLKSLVEYFAFTIIEGDWLNDSLTELDPSVVEWVKELGQAVALLFGN
jgi:hypothetical protein